ncbi:Arm DNA-binding domain-containing protein [Nitrospina gracilis]|uniref:Arm DNA-binding domain-containing protein n=1 Tax=Nitrospina gracilis TaxID=35801 RepID=UPI001F1D5FD0|nr:Arm DNA-binding domain-containing protein [Nitrospina gracilis]MCF8719453.1 hypothetical protein [Nitrospina gracilis Nb-211]
MALASTAVKNAKPSAKTLRLYDERGLYLEISPNGGKWWRFEKRPCIFFKVQGLFVP